MPRTKPKDLTINLKTDPSQPIEPAPNSTHSSPIEFEGIDLSSMDGGIGGQEGGFTSLPTSPSSSPGHSRNQSGNLLNNLQKNKSASRIQTSQDEQRGVEIRRVPRERGDQEDDGMPQSSSMSKIYHLRQNGSTPHLSFLGSKEDVGRSGSEAQQKTRRDRPPLSPHHSGDSTASTRPKDTKPFRNPLARSRSLRRDSDAKKQNGKILVPENHQPLRTAPLQPSWKSSHEDMKFKAKSKDKRGKSSDRAMVATNPSHDNLLFSENDRPVEKVKGKDNFMTAGGKSVMSKAKTGGTNFKTFLNKIGRSGSNSEKTPEVSDSDYVLKVIKLPLIQQTRITRISKRLSDCKDKTEYWMPALPWRCIDFLNLNCESEGLYRIPGSGPQVKSWQRRFDTEHDIDLLNEQDLYDPNNIGSMLKTWLRELPTEIMPSDLQTQLAADLAKDNVEFNKVGQKTPQKLRDALSELSPFNYYLLFAITCHLSLLLSHKDQNRMDLHNLAICIGPCLKLDRWLFNYLVGDWRHCWQGCYTEKQALEDEKLWEMQHGMHGPVAQQEASSMRVNYKPSNADSAVDASAISSGNTSLHEFDAASHSRDDWETVTSSSANDLNRTPDRRPATSHDPSVRRPTGKASNLTIDSSRKVSEEGSAATRTPRQNAHSRSQSELVPPTPTRVPLGAPVYPIRDDS